MVDNIIGAIARVVSADVSLSAVEDIVTAVTANLPLKEDTDEYDTVFKMFAALLAAQHPAFPRCLAKMVESAAVFYSDPNTDKVRLSISAVKRSIGSTTGCTITEKAPTRAFSWLLKAPTSAFTFKTLLRHYDPTVSQCEIVSATQKS